MPQVPRGLEKCVSTMLKGETCELLCRADYGYGNDGKPPDVPPGASVRFELELISFVAPRKERSELTATERYEEAVRLKGAGTAAFGSGLWLDAQVHYHEVCVSVCVHPRVDNAIWRARRVHALHAPFGVLCTRIALCRGAAATRPPGTPRRPPAPTRNPRCTCGCGCLGRLADCSWTRLAT